MEFKELAEKEIKRLRFNKNKSVFEKRINGSDFFLYAMINKDHVAWLIGESIDKSLSVWNTSKTIIEIYSICYLFFSEEELL